MPPFLVLPDCRLTLSGSGLLQYTTFLPLCHRLEMLSLVTNLSSDEGRLLCSQIW